MSLQQTHFTHHFKRKPSWIYDEPDIRQGINDGTYKIEEKQLYSNFTKWLNEATIVTTRNIESGELLKQLSSKRGNIAYAIKHRKKLREVELGLAEMQWDYPFGQGRTLRSSLLFIVTFTVDQKRYDKQEAWKIIGREIAKFKIQLKRDLGNDFSTLLVKEGSQSGYPAPHLLVMVEHPVLIYRHLGKNFKPSWRIQDKNIVDKVKSRWKMGFVDIQAVVDGSINDGGKPKDVTHYIFKYLTKANNIDESSEDYDLQLKQNAWQKLFRTYPCLISKAFKERLNVRLDNNRLKSQHNQESKWEYVESTICPLSEYQRYLMDNPPHPPN